MRRLTAGWLALSLVVACAACNRKPKVQAKPVEDETQLVSVIHVADPRAAVQIVRGFHGVESNTWRWTMKSFVVTLKTPPGGAEKGATLQLKFVIPEVVISKTGPISISATVNGAALAKETYTEQGDRIYERDVPASALSAEMVTVEFAVDKSVPPSPADSRELAIIATTIGLEAK